MAFADCICAKCQQEVFDDEETVETKNGLAHRVCPDEAFDDDPTFDRDLDLED